MRWMRLAACAALMGFFGTGSNAAAGVPDVLSAPVVLYDEGGNVLADGEYGVTLKLSDDTGTIYEEEQLATVTGGVAALTIGSGYAPGSSYGSPAGGLSSDLFVERDNVSVSISVVGQSTIQEIAVLGSQPYAFVSEYALGIAADAVIGESIRDGSITAADLEPSFLSELQSSVLVDSGGVAITAANVALSSGAALSNSGATTVEGALQDLDGAIESLRDIDLAQSIDGVEGDLSTHAAAVAGVHGVGGEVVGTDDAQTLTHKTLDATNEVSGDAVVSGTVAELYVDAAIARDSELLFANLGGSLSDAQIPSDITRDSELLFSNLGGEASDVQIPTSIARDSELAFANLSGALSDAQIPSDITRDTELLFSNLGGEASDAQIPTSIARDSELAFANLSGALNDAQIPSAITRDSELAFSSLSGTASDSQIPSSIARDSEVSTDVDALDDRVTDLESDTITEPEVPAAIRPFAYGTVTRASGGTCLGYNMDSDCTFTTEASDANYAVVITAESASTCGSYSGECYVASKAAAGFSVTCHCPSGGTYNPKVGFVVFKN